MRLRISSTFWLLLLIPVIPATAQNYAIEQLSSEDTMNPPPFSITRVAPFPGGLRLFLSTGNPDAVAGLLAGGALQAQLSDHQAEIETQVVLVLGKAVWCTEDDDPVFLGYFDPLPDCEGNPPVRIEYFFEVFVTLGPGRDLAIGQDPDFLWLIEES